MICQKVDLSVMRCKFSPLHKDLIAIGGSENFGLAGQSLIYLLFAKKQSRLRLESGLSSPKAKT